MRGTLHAYLRQLVSILHRFLQIHKLKPHCTVYQFRTGGGLQYLSLPNSLSRIKCAEHGGCVSHADHSPPVLRSIHSQFMWADAGRHHRPRSGSRPIRSTPVLRRGSFRDNHYRARTQTLSSTRSITRSQPVHNIYI